METKAEKKEKMKKKVIAVEIAQSKSGMSRIHTESFRYISARMTRISK